MPDKNKTILFIGTDLHPPPICMEAKMLQAIGQVSGDRGYAVRAVSIRLGHPPHEDPRFTYVTGPRFGPTWLRKPFYGIDLLRRLGQELRGGVAAVHLLWVGFPVLTPSMIRRFRRSELPVVVTVLNRHSPPDRYQGADHIIVHSRKTRERYLQSDYETSAITVQPPPVDTTHFMPNDRPPEPFFVMASGPRTAQQIEERGIHLLLDAFKVLERRNSEAQLHLFNRWVEGADILDRLRAEIGATKVHLHHGPVEDLPHWVARSAGVLIPYVNSRIGELPMSALEAMACGRPVIATAGLGLDEFIEGKKTGLLIEPTPEALADAVEQVLVAPDAWRESTLAAVEGLGYGPFGHAMCDLYDSLTA